MIFGMLTCCKDRASYDWKSNQGEAVLQLLLGVENEGHQLVALPFLAFDKVFNQLPGHLLTEDVGVLSIAAAGGQQGGEEDSLQLSLGEELEGKVGKLLENRWLRTALHD